MHKDSITHGLQIVISSSKWNITRFKMTRASVSQLVGRMSYIQFISMVTRISSHFEKIQKVSGAWSLYPFQFGFICPSDTPEGCQCGFVKIFTLTAYVIVSSDHLPVKRILFNLGVEEIFLYSGEEIFSNYIVLLNGNPLGIMHNSELLCYKFRQIRRRNWIDKFTAVGFLNRKDMFLFLLKAAGFAVF
jgi:DNA-directed RNA polymerase III subunit RPC2